MDPDLDGVLPPGVTRDAAGTPPPAPASFGDAYVLPTHTHDKPLQKTNTHPLDSRLVFYEEPHVYTFDGAALSASVTALAHQFEKPFVAAEAISGMKTARSQAWPRLEYVRGAAAGDAAWTPASGLLLVRDGKTVAVLPPHTMAAGTTTGEARRMLRLASGKRTVAWEAKKEEEEGEEEEEVHTFERAMEDAEIVQAWQDKGAEASHRGTEAHYMAELFFNGLPCRWWEGEMSVLFSFVREHLLPRGLVAHNTEKEIVCADADVAGSIDLILWDPAAKLYHIVDHKRSDKLETQMRGYGKMCGALSHLDDCKGAAYALQTSIYQYVLERDYGMPIGDRVLLSLHPDKPFTTRVPYLAAEAAYIMENRMALTAARRRVAERDPERFRCSLSGKPAVDAVRCADGAVAAEKAAMLEKTTKPPEPDEEVRAAFEEAVMREYAPVALDTTACVSWKRQMPVGGLRPTWVK